MLQALQSSVNCSTSYDVELVENFNFPNNPYTSDFIADYINDHGHVESNGNIFIASSPDDKHILELIIKFMGIKETIETDITFGLVYTLNIKQANALDFMNKLYTNLITRKEFKGNKIFNKIIGPQPVIKFVKTDANAVTPAKARFSDVGFDLAIVKEIEKINSVTTFYDTGIAVQPPQGYYIKVVPRSSLSKTGYMLTNSVAIVDSSYTGSIRIMLTKVDPNAKPITFPFLKFQMIVEKQIYPIFKEVKELVTTNRGSGGFGSTDKVTVQDDKKTN